jgi:hypothetical protein
MGFLGGDNDTPRTSPAEDRIDQQYQENEQELAVKKANLFRTRFDIIKSQGAQQWTPDYSVSSNAPSSSALGSLGKN